LTRAEFPKHVDGHYYLPILISANYSSTFIPRFFVDCGATKCVIPRLANEKSFHLPVTDPDSNVGTGCGDRDFDCVTIPSISIMKLVVKQGKMKFIETDLREIDVGCWLSDDEDFVLGMSFLSKFNVTMTKKGIIAIQR